MLLSVAVLAGAPSAWALDDVDDLETEIISSQTSNGRAQIRANVEALRKAIENDSYKTTLRLCLAYRAANGLNTHSTDGHTYTLADSLRAWSEISSKGLRNSFLSWYYMGDNKAYSDLEEFDFFTANYWDSAHLVMFLNSTGFLTGAVHCLNTTNRIEIERFAAYIVTADSYATGLGHSLGFGSQFVVGTLAGKGFLAALKSTQRWWHYLNPLAGALKYSKRILFTRKAMGAIGLTLGAAGGYKLYCREKAVRVKNFEESLRDKGLDNPTARFGAILLLYQTYSEQHGLCRQKLNKDELFLSDLDQCAEEKTVISELIEQLHLRNHIQDLKQDLTVYSRKKSPSPELESKPIQDMICLRERPPGDVSAGPSTSQLYVTMLSAVMPILNTAD